MGSDLLPETRDFNPKQVTVMEEKSQKILARLRFNEDIVFFKIEETILIVSAGGGIYVFCLKTFKKIESLQCNSMFQTFLTTMPGDKDSVDVFRVVFTDPNGEGKLCLYTCKSAKKNPFHRSSSIFRLDEHIEPRRRRLEETLGNQGRQAIFSERLRALGLHDEKYSSKLT